MREEKLGNGKNGKKKEMWELERKKRREKKRRK